MYEIYAITGTFYALNIGSLGIADPAVIVQTIFAAGEFTIPLLSAVIFPVLVALVFGRVWCGWMCPYHVLADAAQWIRSKVRLKLFRRDNAEHLPVASSFRANVWRYAFLVLGAGLAGAVGIPVLNYVNAPGITSTEAMILVKERTVSIELAFIAAILLLETTILPRFWCRLFCPTGSCVALCRTKFTLRVGTDIANPKRPCCNEHPCTAACPMGLEPYREGADLLCTNCGRCIDACARMSSGRLKFKGFM
jgi:ferredoxin-type protein NapH